MISLSRFREQYPEYNDMGDEEVISRAARVGIQVLPPQGGPERLSLLDNAATAAWQAIRGEGGRQRLVAEEAAAQAGNEAIRAPLAAERELREQELRARQERMRPGRLADLPSNPAGVISGAIGTAIGSIPFYLNPLLRMPGLIAGFAGGNLQEQGEAQNLPVGERSLLTAGTVGAGQAALDRYLGLGQYVSGGFRAGVGNAAQRGVRGAISGAIGEGLQEGITDALTIVQGDLSNPGRVLEEESLGRLAESAVLGAIGGGAIQGAISAATPADRPPDAPVDPGAAERERLAAALRTLQGVDRVAPTTPVAPEAPPTPTMALPAPPDRLALPAPEDTQEPPIVPPEPSAPPASPPPTPPSAPPPVAPTVETPTIVPATPEGNTVQTEPNAAQGLAGASSDAGPTGAPLVGDQEAPSTPPPEARESGREAADAPTPGGLFEAITTMEPENAPQETVEKGKKGKRAAPKATPKPPPFIPPANRPAAIEAMRVVEQAMGRFADKGEQGASVSRAVREQVVGKLRAGDVTPEQAAAAFEMADALATILPSKARQAIEFAPKVLSAKTGNEVQGIQQRTPNVEGVDGLIRLSLAENMLPMGRETAAHEAWHVIQDWLAKSDPILARSLEKAFPKQTDGTVRLDTIDATLRRTLRRHQHPSGRSYYEYIASTTDRGPGVFSSPAEAEAIVFGGIYDIRKTGAPVKLSTPLQRILDMFGALMDRLRGSRAARVMESAAAGGLRNAEPAQQATTATAAQETRESKRTLLQGPPDPPMFSDAEVEEAQRGDGAVVAPRTFGAIRADMFMNRPPAELVKQIYRADDYLADTLMTPEPLGLKMTLSAMEGQFPKGYAPLFKALDESIPNGVLLTSNYTEAAVIVRPDGTPVKRLVGAPSHVMVDRLGVPSYVQVNIDSNLRDLKYPHHSLVLLHEAVHAATLYRLAALREYALMGDTDAQKQLKALDMIRYLAMEQARKSGMSHESLSAGTMEYAITGTPDDPLGQANSGRAEFLAEAMQSPYFQAFLGTVPLTPAARNAIMEVTGSSPRNILEAMVDWVKGILGIKGSSVLDGAFVLAPYMLNVPMNIEPDDTRASERNLPPEAQEAIDRLAPSEPARLLSRATTNRVWSSALRGKARAAVVDTYSVVEDMERMKTGQNRLPAETSGYVALWRAVDTDRFVSQALEAGGYVELEKNPNNPLDSQFRVNPSQDGGLGWLVNMMSGIDQRTGEPLRKADGSRLIDTEQEAKKVLRAFQLYSIAKRGTNLNERGIVNQVGDAERLAAAQAAREFPEIVPAFEAYQKYNANLMKMAVDSGVLTQADAKAFMRYNDYYPFYRAIPENDPIGASRIAGVSTRFKPKEILGGENPFVADPLEAIIENTSYWVNASMKNVAMQKVVDTGLHVGVIRKFDKKNDQPANKVSVRIKGMDYSFATDDPHLLSALNSYYGLDPAWQGLARIFGWPARMLREIVTKEPGFMLVANPVRDSMAAWISSGSDIVPVIDAYKGMFGAVTRDEDTMKYLSMGHSGSRRFEDGFFRSASDIYTSDILVQKGIYRAGSAGELMGVLNKAWLAWDKVAEASDISTRVAIYHAEKAKGASDAEAGWRAREIMNFSKRGNSQILRVLSALVPFTNARIQGMDILWQSATGKRIGDPRLNRDQRILKTLVRGAIMTMAAVGIYMMVQDDDEVKEAPLSLRNTNILIPLRMLGLADSGLLAIPKPFEYGLLFMTLPEQLYRLSTGDQSVRGFVREAGQGAWSALAYNPIPTAVLPFVEQATNYSFFTGQPVIGRALQREAPEWQFTQNTPAIYRDMARAFAETGIPTFMERNGLPVPAFMSSPVAMDHLVRSFTAGLGTQAAIAAGALVGSEEFREWDWTKLPIANRIIRSQNSSQPAGVNSLYELADESAKIATRIRRYAEAGEHQMVERLTRENSRLIAAGPLIAELERRIGRMAQEEREVMRNTSMPIDERRERLEQIAERRRSAVSAVRELRLRLEQ